MSSPLLVSSTPSVPAESDEDIQSVQIPPASSTRVADVLLLILLSPLLLIVFVVLGLIGLIGLPFRKWSHHHSSSARQQPKSDTIEHKQAAAKGAWFQSNTNGTWIYYRRWMPSVADHPVVRGVVYGAHVFGEHISRDGYEVLAHRLNAMGFALVMNDHQGHGHSTGDRAFYESIDDVVHDFVQLIEMPITERPVDDQVPRFIFGHSMGGIVGMTAALQMLTPEFVGRNPNFLFEGVVLSSPCFALDPKLATPPLKFAARVLSGIMPKLVLEKLPTSYLSRNVEAVKKYEDDPLIWHGGARARVGAEMLKGMKTVLDQLHTFKKPIILLHGTKDAVVPPFASTYVYNGVASDDKTFIKFSGLFHEMFEDPDCDRFFSAIVSWVDSHASSSIGRTAPVTGRSESIEVIGEVAQRKQSISSSLPTNVQIHPDESEP